MARRLTLLALLALAAPLGCPVENPTFGSEECVGNTAPSIDNLEVNSYEITEGEGAEEMTVGWAMCVHFDWIDPGFTEGGSRGSDAPNMYGGLFSLELEGYSLGHNWLDEESGVTPGQDSGEFEKWLCLQDSENMEDAVVDFTVRLRDRCDAASNTKSGTYIIGGGSGGESHLVENPEAGSNGCQGIPVCFTE